MSGPTSGDPHQETAHLKLPSGRAKVYVVRVVDGPDHGKALQLEGQEPGSQWVGTSPRSALTLTDPTVSRRHLAFELDARGLRLTDAGSTNGTLVNGVRVGSAWLQGGERLQMGQTTLDVTASLAPAPELLRLDQFGAVVGSSVAMRRIYPLCARLAQASIPLIIEGETGTGKEVLAESLHAASSRAARPFVVFDCTAVPPSLLESALFGHERGAFTGANQARQGVFEEAHGGTLFIDEIGDLQLDLQASLLRAVERGEVRRIGGKQWLKVDVRVIAATRRDLDELVAAGRFRDDLYYRLGVASIELPPLRERHGDVELLTRHFWRQHDPSGAPPAEFLRSLEGQRFPGNVRELANRVARQVVLGELTLAPATPEVPDPSACDFIDAVIAEGLSLSRARERVAQELEARYVRAALQKSGGSVTEAAKNAGVARRYFQLLRARVSGAPR